MTFNKAAKIFASKSTARLHINLYESPEKAIRWISTVFETLRITNKIDLLIEERSDYSPYYLEFFTSIGRGRNLSQIEVKIVWKCKERQEEATIREGLKLLPTMRKIQIEYWYEALNESGNYHGGTMMDDQLLLHLISKSNHTEIRCNALKCTAKGVVRAFEIFCESPSTDKFVLIVVRDSILAEIFKVADEKDKYLQRGDHGFCTSREGAKKRRRLQVCYFGRDETTVVVMRMKKKKEEIRPTWLP